MPTILPIGELPLDFAKMALSSDVGGTQYPTELSKLNGLITFTRASTGTRFNKTGAIETVATGQPRFDFNPVTLLPRGLLIEESRTNRIVYSESTTGWAADGSPVRSNAYRSIYGLAGQLVLKAASGSPTTAAIYQTPTTATGETITISAYVYDEGAHWCYLYTVSKTGAGFFAYFNLATNTIGTVTGGATAGYDAGVGGQKRIWITLPMGVTGANAGMAYFGIAAADGSQAVSALSTSQGMSFAGMQMEAGDFPSSYIPTTTAPVTRAADSVTLTSLSPWYYAHEGTLCVDAEIPVGAPAGFFAVLDDGSDANRIFIYRSGTGGNCGVSASSVGVSNLYPAFLASGRNRVAYSFKVGAYSASVNGSTVLVDTASTLAGSITTLRIGQGAGGGFVNGPVRRLLYLPYKVSDSLLKALTTI